MVALKTYQDLFSELFFGGLGFRAAVQFLMLILPWMLFQWIMLWKCRRRLLRLLPLLLVLLCVCIGEIMTAMTAGWDALGWGILTNYFAYGLLGDLCGVILWVVRQKIKNCR